MIAYLCLVPVLQMPSYAFIHLHRVVLYEVSTVPFNSVAVIISNVSSVSVNCVEVPPSQSSEHLGSYSCNLSQ